MAENPLTMAENRHESKPKKFTGVMKWLDTHGIGYIRTDDSIDVFVTPHSFSSKAAPIKQGDTVRYGLKTRNSNVQLEAVDVTRYGSECNWCYRTGHSKDECPDNVRYYWVKCYKCGLIGHKAGNCSQKFYGFFNDKRIFRDGFVRRSCECDYGCWLSLFGGPCRKKVRINNVNYGGFEFEYSLAMGSFGVYWPPLCKSFYVGDDDNDAEDDDGEEVSYVVCVKKVDDVKKVEKDEDCFILDFDPNELPKLENLSLCDKFNDDDDVCILAQKGKVACRDYPHPRHLCGTNSFENTPHQSHCKMCYCYICDVPAPCKNWTKVSEERLLNHCDASDDIQFWRIQRKLVMFLKDPCHKGKGLRSS